MTNHDQTTIDGSAPRPPFAEPERHEAMRLFAPAPAQIPGQTDMLAALEVPADDPPAPAAGSGRTRERRERRAERLRDWADGRDRKSSEAYAASSAVTDAIPFGQPILVGHHSEKGHRAALNRAHAAMDRSCEHAGKAADMRSRADGIDAQQANAIYSDDVDAVERLAEKVARLEAQRDHVKRLNTAARKGTLTEEERLELARANRHAPIPGAQGGFPAYVLTNLGSEIRRNRKRLEELQRPERPRTIALRYAGECRKCGAELEKGATARYFKRAGELECVAC